jgi:hypothetical protein
VQQRHRALLHFYLDPAGDAQAVEPIKAKVKRIGVLKSLSKRTRKAD